MFEMFEEFAQRFPSIITGMPDAPLAAFFGSYRKIGRYPTGPIQVGPDLKISVANGDGRPMDEMSGLALDLAVGFAKMDNQEISAEERLHRALRGRDQEIVDNNLDAAILTGNGPLNLMLCLYCGPSGFTLAVKTAKKFREQHPAALIVGMSCTCLQEDQLDVIESENSPFDYFSTSDDCGMEQQMAELLEILISTWPTRKKTA